MSLDKHYQPQAVEDRVYAFWEANDLFDPETSPYVGTEFEGAPFSIVIPPPNVTGTLHIGHALDDTLQDVLIRWHRMLGDNTLWMPGMDHAGIATQSVVERELAKEGKTRQALGRDAFVARVWDWANARKQDIWDQFKRLGISPDWNRQRFTLDEGCSTAVRHAFVELYKAGLIYKGTYIVNWSPGVMSAISDIETEYEDREGHLWHILYPFADGPIDGVPGLVVATTRPETMFGDVAVAVNPQDERFARFIGKQVKLPLSPAADATIPVIGDDYVDTSFGTGALKITPAHDPNDFEIGKKHQLKPVWVLDETAALKAVDRVPTELHGVDRFEARKRIEAMLEAAGFLKGKEAHSHRVGVCQRSGQVVEPLLSEQWFLKCKPLADTCLAALDNGQIRFIPERWTKIYVDWMENIRDWCISRQLWWGHQIPAWTCQDCGALTVSQTDPAECSQCGKTSLTQETDVMDTWFSSGLWPMSTMGWPDEQAGDYQTYYPTSVLVTGFDIIFFWVARMTMLGHYFSGESPFHTVYIHGLIRDEKGQKMSKSKGNTIDPVEVIDEYGTDALRYSLISLVTYGGQDIKLSKEKFEQGKLFANKLWNASRFVLMNLEQHEQGWGDVDCNPIDEDNLSAMDTYILTELMLTGNRVRQYLEQFRFGEMADELYKFTWDTFCDWYVEYAKKQMRDEDPKVVANTQRILLHVLDNTLRLLHPLMPFITEEIWQKLPHIHETAGDSIMVAPYYSPCLDEDTIEDLGKDQALMEFTFDTIRAVRNIRQTSGVPLNAKIALMVDTADVQEQVILNAYQDVLAYFLKLTDFTLSADIEDADFQDSPHAVGVVGQSRLIVTFEADAVDTEAQRERQEQKLAKLQKEYDQLNGLLTNEKFVAKAPDAVIAKNRDKLDEVTQQMDTLRSEMGRL